MRALSLSALITCCVILCAPQAAWSQYQRSMINAGFESNDPQGPGPANWQPFADTDVPGWFSTTGFIEEWDSNFLDVASYAGNVHAELNYASPGTLYQELCLLDGDVFTWSFAHRARSGGPAIQNITFEVADSSGSVIQTLGAQASTVPDGWNVNSDSGVIYSGPSGIQRVQFRTTNPGSYGNFLDGIGIFLNPFVEFSSASNSGSETVADTNLGTIIISGNVGTAFDVAVTVTGGSATLGDDFTTPTGTSSFNVTIPVGNYFQQSIPLGISILDDTDVESTETIDFTITAAPAIYTIASSVTCGAAGQSVSTYSIVDNDSRVTLNKQWVSAAVGDDSTLTLSRGATVIDTLDSEAGTANELDTDPTPTEAIFGETIVFAESLAAANNGDYIPTLACTGAADTDLSDGLTIGTGETAINCTYTNTRSNLSIAKTVEVVSDDVNLTVRPKAVPGAILRYCILTTNVGGTTAEAVSATDVLIGPFTYVPNSMLSGSTCATATTPEDDDSIDDAFNDESDPFGMSISGVTITGTTATLAPGATFAMVFEVKVD